MDCTASTVLLVLFTVGAYTLYGAYWRLYLSPVARFPGSKLAALTFWYEFYYDVVKGGQYVYEIERLHRIYSPIIRINPYELSVHDTNLAFINKLYPSIGVPVDKFWWSAGMFGNNEMTFGTIQHGLHKQRRAAFRKFFSRAAIVGLEPVIRDLVKECVGSIADGIEKNGDSGENGVVKFVHAFSALTQDVITEYCFSKCRHVLREERFAPHWYEWMQVHCTFTPIIKQFPWLLPFLNTLPDWFIKTVNPAAYIIRFQEAEYLAQIQSIKAPSSVSKSSSSHPTIFREILSSPGLPPSEKSNHRLMAEAESLVGAGTLTTAHMLALTSYFILANDNMCEKLVRELESVWPNADEDVDVGVIEGLEYLNAVMDEGFRLSYGSMHRLSRVHPTEELAYRAPEGDERHLSYIIPAGTAVGYSPSFLHRDPRIFPDPEAFKPSRWLGLSPKDRQTLRAHLNNFGRGTRQCVGMQLAYAEIYLPLGYLFRRLGRKMRLYETGYKRDVAYVQGYFIPAPAKGSRGVRVVQSAF